MNCIHNRLIQLAGGSGHILLHGTFNILLGKMLAPKHLAFGCDMSEDRFSESDQIHQIDTNSKQTEWK